MYCIDMDSIHMSGISNGGMFMYYAGRDGFYALAQSKKYFMLNSTYFIDEVFNKNFLTHYSC